MNNEFKKACLGDDCDFYDIDFPEFKEELTPEEQEEMDSLEVYGTIPTYNRERYLDLLHKKRAEQKKKEEPQIKESEDHFFNPDEPNSDYAEMYADDWEEEQRARDEMNREEYGDENSKKARLKALGHMWTGDEDMSEEDFLEGFGKAMKERHDRKCCEALGEDYALVETKSVIDSDGFMTDYTWYKRVSDGLNVFVFGDSDTYRPEDGDFDFETESDKEASDWFNTYEGFLDEIEDGEETDLDDLTESDEADDDEDRDSYDYAASEVYDAVYYLGTEGYYDLYRKKRVGEILNDLEKVNPKKFIKKMLVGKDDKFGRPQGAIKDVKVTEIQDNVGDTVYRLVPGDGLRENK